MTTPDEAQALLRVTQADRDAAAKCYAEFVGFEEAVDEGDWMAGHFARHRISHSIPGDVGTVRIDNLAARKAVNCVLAPLLAPYISDMPELIEVGNQACTEILAALTPSALSGDAGEGAMAKRTLVLCVSGKGPTPYLEVHFANLADAHAAHNELLGIKEEPNDA